MSAALVFALALAATQGPCAVDNAALLALPFDRFDEDAQGGWRPLGAQAGCEGAAADLLAQYREAHWGKLSAGQTHVLYWQEGQMRAMAGQTARAVRLLLGGVDPDGAIDFEDYALGTVAFLHRDLNGLKAARARLAVQPKSAEFAQVEAGLKAAFDANVSWPLNLDVLDGLIACFDKPYKEAYAVACREQARAH